MLHVPFTADRLLLNLELTDPLEIVRTLARALCRAPGMPAVPGPEDIALLAARRDEEGESRRFGPRAVLLHVRLDEMDGARLALCTLSEPIPWTDGGEARLVALLAAPRERPVQSLRFFRSLGSLLSDPAAAGYIGSADDATALAQWLDDRLEEEDGTLTAADVMRSATGMYGADLSLPQLAKRMAQYGHDAAGVTDAHGRFIGMVTADAIFTLGMPDFFKQLESVAFLPEFDPFERYFAKGQQLRASDALVPNPVVVSPDTPILEVVFALAVKGAPKVFVCEDGRLVGVIDRIRVIDRILEL
ncbi:MAG: CBS domain-containing protein [Deltaproteobacteria bacterium]|nr:MAG: CBS domain-containing protein [Deltaproteobacteria bacterium]